MDSKKGMQGLYILVIVSTLLIVIILSTENKTFSSSFNVSDVITTKDLNNKDFLTDYEASQYLGISWEALITLVKNGSYNGNYIKEYFNESETIYIFPREELKNWFDEYIKNNTVIKADSSLLPEK